MFGILKRVWLDWVSMSSEDRFDVLILACACVFGGCVIALMTLCFCSIAWQTFAM